MKKIFRKIMFLTLSILFVICVSCSKADNTNNSKSKVFNISIIQLIQHAALDNAYQGFVDGLKELGVEAKFDYQNASGEQSACQTIAEKFINDKPDLICAIATPAAEAVVAINENIPIVATAVTDPMGAGLLEDNEKPNGMLTAASDLTPVEAQFELLKELIPNAKNVGVLYCSAEANSKIQADLARVSADKLGLNVTEYTIVSSNDIQTVVESMVGKVDVIYVPTDNTIASGFATVATIANENKIPTIVGEESLVELGGYATYGIDYYSLGKLTAQMAKEILVDGKKISEMPVRYLDSNSCKRSINKETAKILGLPEE